MLTDLFSGVRSTLILVPKKNGKSTLLGALALYHLWTVRDAECVIAAASRDQAAIMLRQAQGFIRRSEALQTRFQTKQREVVYTDHGGRVRILASDVDTSDGVIPTLALVDELHRHKTPDLYGVFRDGLGPREGKMVTISTAGDAEDSPLGRLRADALALPGIKREGAHTYARTDGFAYHEWALADADDRADLELVKQANPASWQTVEALRQRHDDPSMTPWQWARFACGVWLAGEDSAISSTEWSACVGNREIPDDAEIVVGVDLGWKWDTTAIVPVWRDDVLMVGEPEIIVPPRDGTATDHEEIWRPIEELAARYDRVTFVLDPEAGGEQLAQRIEDELPACEVIAHSQKASPMALAAQRLSEAISGGQITHPDDPYLNAQVLAAAAKPVGEGWRLVKSKRTHKPIDGAIALAMAVSVLTGDHEVDVAENVW